MGLFFLHVHLWKEQDSRDIHWKFVMKYDKWWVENWSSALREKCIYEIQSPNTVMLLVPRCLTLC